MRHIYIYSKIQNIVNYVENKPDELTSCLTDWTCWDWRGCDTWKNETAAYFSKAARFHASEASHTTLGVNLHFNERRCQCATDAFDVNWG